MPRRSPCGRGRRSCGASRMRPGPPVLHPHPASSVLERPARAGWDLHELARFAGHRNVSVTQHYIHLSGRDLDEKLTAGMGADPPVAHRAACRARARRGYDEAHGTGGDRGQGVPVAALAPGRRSPWAAMRSGHQSARRSRPSSSIAPARAGDSRRRHGGPLERLACPLHDAFEFMQTQPADCRGTLAVALRECLRVDRTLWA